jgi:thiamine pyrophosphokinase
VLLSSENLKWELNNTELEFGKNEGARNQSTKEFVKIFVHSGIFLLFLDSKAPKCPKFL